MNQTLKQLGAVTAFALLGAVGAIAGSSSSAAMSAGSSSDISSAESGSRALLDTLVKKGVITDQEAEEIGVKMTQDEVTSPNVKFEQSLGIKKLMFYGDMRMRYEIREGSNGLATGNPNDHAERDRFRYRLRFGFKADLVDDWFAGFRLATNPFNQRSGNVTFGDGGSSGPFGKSKSLVSIDQVYIGWKPTDWFTFEVGRMANPLYTTSMVWDPNINIDGVAEMFHHQFNDHFQVFGNFIQAMYGDATTDNSLGTSPNFTDIFMFIEQVGAQYNFTKDMYGKIAASMYTYSGTNNGANSYSDNPFAAGSLQQPAAFGGTFGGDLGTNQNLTGIVPTANNTWGINNLSVVEIPAEFGFKIGKLPMKVYEDFAINTDADTRAARATHPGRGDADGYAWQAGVQINKAKKKGDWQVDAFWQRTGAYAVDPNLIDADIFDARTNMQGFVVGGTYNFTDAISGTVRYANASRIDDSVGTAGTAMGTPGTEQDLGNAVINHYQLVQFDLNWKF